MGLPFSLDKMQPVGEPFPAAARAREPTVAADGTLVYIEEPRATGNWCGATAKAGDWESRASLSRG